MSLSEWYHIFPTTGYSFEQVKSFNENRKDMELQMVYSQDRLSEETARFAAGFDAVCLFVNDTADAEALSVLSMCGVRRNMRVSDTMSPIL